MMRLLSVIVLAAVLVGTRDIDAQQKQVAATDGWIKLPAAGATSATAFVVIQNPTAYDVYVVSAETDVASKVQLQRAKTPDTKPEPIESFTVDAYGSVTMKPDGVQLLLLDLKRPLKVGETVRLSLATDSGAPLEVEAVVRN